MRGAIPPATNTPPVASTMSPRFPATAPRTEQKIAERHLADRVGAGERALGDRGGGIVVRGRAGEHGGGLGADEAAAGGLLGQEREHVDQTLARQHPLAGDAPVLDGQELHQPLLERRARRQVDVPPLGRDDLVAVLGRRPEQKGLPEAGARPEHGDRPLRARAVRRRAARDRSGRPR